jgi:rhodanese-related sulfurtransferase
MSLIHNVNVITLNSWLNAAEIIIVDVREPYEYKEGHIEGATNLPLSTILVEIHQIQNIQGKKIVLQCKVGGRSMRACQLLQAEGFKQDVWNLEGGIDAWKEAGYNIIVN